MTKLLLQAKILNFVKGNNLSEKINIKTKDHGI